MDIFSIIKLFGGLAMFLYGMEVMSDGLGKCSGAALERVLGTVTRNVFTGLLTGILVTAVIQSSAATIVLAVGLISVGILNLKQAVSIVLGANIGTTVTAQLIRLMDIDASGSSILQFFKPSTLAPIALIVGIIMVMFLKKGKTNGTGQILVGFGVLFTGLINMTAAVEPLAGSDVFIEVLTRFSDVPVLGIITGLVVTVIVQSSSATVGMLQALSSTGVLTFSLVYPIIMGINLGTCVTTAAICSIGSSKDAKRTGIVHIVFNIVGTVLFMIAMSILFYAGAFNGLWEKVVNSGDIANFQTLFNLITALVLLPSTGLLVKLSMFIIKPDGDEGKTPEWCVLDDKLYISPAVALAETERSISFMGEAARDNLHRGRLQLMEYNPALSESISVCEDTLDKFADTADNYLVKLSKYVASDKDNRHINILMQATTNFERLGDYATNLLELAERLKTEKLEFSDMAKAELDYIFDAVEEIIGITMEAFRKGDSVLARRIEPLEEVIDDMVAMLKDRHIDRLKSGTCAISAGLVFMDTLTYLERAADQCSSTAMLMLGQENEAILQNHHEYLRELHKGGSDEYMAEFMRKRDEYITPLENMLA